MALIFLKHEDVAQVSPALPGSNRLVARSFSHRACVAGNCVVLPLAENPPSCSEHPLGSLPLFLSLLPFLRSSLAASSLNLSLPLLSSASTFPSPHASTSPPPPHFGSAPPSLHSYHLPSVLCPIAGVTAAELGKHSLRCSTTLHTIMCHLCIAQDVVGVTLQGWRVLPEDIMFALFVFTGK